MNELKKAFDAARVIYGHKNQEQAANHMGYSLTNLTKFWSGKLPYPDNMERAIRKYIRQSGIIKTIRDQGLDPNDTKKKLTTANA